MERMVRECTPDEGDTPAIWRGCGVGARAVLTVMGGIGSYDGSHYGCLARGAGIDLAPTLSLPTDFT